MSDTDDTPLWVEVADVVFGPALFVRTLIHILVASDLTEIDAAVGHSDVSLASPVPELRATRGDVIARCLSALMALVAVVFVPEMLPAAGDGLVALSVSLWLSANVVLLWSDPVLLLLWNNRRQHKPMSDTQETDGGGIDG